MAVQVSIRAGDLLRLIAVIVLLLAQTVAFAKAGDNLPPRYRAWLERDAGYIITSEEKETFLKLSTDAERDKFIDNFWEIRNTTPGAPTNAFKEEHYRRLAYADQFFNWGTRIPGWRTDKGRIYILLGEPKQKAVYYGYQKLRKMEIWFYSNSHPALPPFFNIVFYQKDDQGDFRLYSPYMDGPEKLVTTDPGSRPQSLKVIDDQAGREVARTALSLLPDEPVDFDGATSSLQSDVMLSTIRNLANNPLNKDLLRNRRALLEGVTHRVILGEEFVRIMTSPMRDANGNVSLHYLLRLLRPEDFSIGKANDDHYYYNVEVAARVYTQDHKLVYTQQRNVSQFFSEAEYARVKNRSFGFEGTLPIAPGKYAIDFTLTNKLRSTAVRASTQVTVPDVPSDGLAIVGLVPFSDAQAVDPNLNVPFSGGGVRFMPLSAQNLEIPLGADLKVLYQIWAPPGDPRKYAGKKLVVEYVWGRVAIAGQVKSVRDDVAREQFDPHGSMLNGKVISLSDAPAGNYRMVVTIVDPETQHKTYGTLNFAVVPRLSDSTATWYVYDEKRTDTTKLAEDDYDRALCYLATGNQENALYWLAAAIERNPQDQLALSKLVSLYSEKKDFTRIAALYPRFVVNKDTNEETVIQVADALQRTGRLPQAVGLLETTSSTREPSGALLLALSGYYRQMGQVEKANAVEQRGKSLLKNSISSQ